MVLVSDVRKAQAFITVVFKKSIEHKDVLDGIVKQNRLAELCDKPRYLLIEDGADWSGIQSMSWNKVIRFTGENDIPKIMSYIDREITGGGFYN